MLRGNGIFGRYVKEKQKDALFTVQALLEQAHANQSVLGVAPQNGYYIEDEPEEEEESVRLQREQEEREEESRIAIYDKHLSLIKKGLKTHSFDWFSNRINELEKIKPPISRFSDSEKIGLPVIYNEEEDSHRCLFHTILLNPYLEKHEKISLIQQALNTTYRDYYTSLLSGDLFAILAQDPVYHPLARTLYWYSLKDKNNSFTLDETSEAAVWIMFFRALEPVTVFNGLMRAEKPNPDRMMRYIAFWMDNLIDKQLIIDYYEDIIKFHMNRENFMPTYMMDIQAICKQRILAIELDEKLAASSTSSSSSKSTEDFLNLHRHYSMFARWGSTTSAKIHHLIETGQLETAKAWYQKDREELAKTIDARLHQEPGEHAQFRLR